MEQGKKEYIGEQSEVKKCGLGEKKGREACRLCFDGAHLLIICNYPVTHVNKAISPVKLWCFLCWNVHVLASKTFTCTWVYLLLTCQRSVIWPIRSWFLNLVAWMSSIKTKFTGSLPFFSPRPHLAHFACRFFLSPNPLGCLFAGYSHISIFFRLMETEYESTYYSVWDNILKNHIFIRAHASLIIKTTSLVIKKLENLQTNVHVWVARHFTGYQNISL